MNIYIGRDRALLGTKIRELRQQKGMTLNELADKTDVTASYLSQLERNIIDPSLSSLRKISAAFGVPIYTFLEDEAKHPILILAEERQKLDLPNSSITYEFLTPMASNREVNPKMEIIYFQLNPKSYSNDEMVTHAADEAIFVMQGKLEIFLGEEKYCLKEGDSLYVIENTPHRYYNPSEEKAVGICTICPPIY